MYLQLPLVLSFGGFALASLNARMGNTGCNQDNCLRAVAGTQRGPDHPATASADCSSYLQTTVTPPPVTVYTTTTVTLAPTPKGKRLVPAIPSYASACSGAVRYSSACSCLGIMPATITAPTPTTTQTVTTTVSSIAPTCTNTSTDPKNCGTCGNVCPEGTTCQNGSCSDVECQGQTCDTGFTNCNNNDNCYCFTSSSGTGFCGQNAICSELTACSVDADCGTGSGRICAVNSCCPVLVPALPGVCLSPQCANPARKLLRMVKARSKQHGTAAFE